MSSKKATPGKSTTSTTPKKDKFINLFSCGSGKKASQAPPGKVGLASPVEKTHHGEEYEFVNRDIVTTKATRGHNMDGQEIELSYTDLKLIGKGTFGIVYKARLCDTNETVAIKKVFDDKKYKNRELWFMNQLQHPNIIDLLYYFYSEDAGCRKGERYLNMVLNYMPETLFTLAKCDGLYTKPLLDPTSVKVYTYQLFRCLNYLHCLNICHRDVKPQNLLIDPTSHAVKLCDFGSAKELQPNESNIAYICSRYYRAPELIYGAKDYTCQIDVWSAGCVLAELYQGHPLFPGITGPDQMVEIMKVLGTPTYEDFLDFTQQARDMRLPPLLLPMNWNKVFTKSTPSSDAMNLISRTLVFSPLKRLKPLDVMAHPFYDELRRKGARMVDGTSFPPLFNFTEKEMQLCPGLRDRVLPQNYDDDDWTAASRSAANQNKDNNDVTDGSLKSKLVNIARSSFKKTSFRRKSQEQLQQQQPRGDHQQQQQQQHNFEMDVHKDGEDQVDDVSELDISELASYAREQNKHPNNNKNNNHHDDADEDDDDDDEHHHHHPQRHHHHLHTDMVDLSLNSAEKKKKKKSKKRSQSREVDDVDDDVTDTPDHSPRHAATVTAVVAATIDDDVDQSVTKKHKKKHKKSSRNNSLEDNAGDIDVVNPSHSNRHGNQQNWGDMMGREGNYGDRDDGVEGNDDNDDGLGDDDDDVEVRVVKNSAGKKKVKKLRSKELVFDPEFDSPLPVGDDVSIERVTKKTKKKTADGSDVTQTVVTTTTSSSGKIGGKSGRRAKKTAANDDGDEV